MASQDYLIAIALIEQNLVRAMPLGGKEIKDNLEDWLISFVLLESETLSSLTRLFILGINQREKIRIIMNKPMYDFLLNIIN